MVRLQNGFPTTEREAKEYDERQKAAEEAKEAYLRNLVKVKSLLHSSSSSSST